jgi:hypothetical protein
VKKRSPVIAFLGPSLPAREARALSPGLRVLPPARQGDLWRALTLRPRAIALIDGVFESQPSVWHHEILAALASGVRVVGGASMGALRAAELHEHGMEGAGRIFGWYRSGAIADDAEVALLHASAEHAFRPLTVPLVNVRWAARIAAGRRILSAAEARTLVGCAERIFYQDRTWPRVLAAADPLLAPASRARFRAFAARGLPDLKAEDARACLRLALRDLPPPRERPVPSASALVRRRRLMDSVSRVPGSPGTVPSGQVLSALRARADAAALGAQGLRRLLIAGFAAALGLAPSPEEIAAAETGWLSSLGVGPRGRVAFFAASGLAGDEVRAICTTLALEEIALQHAARLIADGPSPDEGLALEARLQGIWSAVVRELAGRGR